LQSSFFFAVFFIQNISNGVDLTDAFETFRQQEMSGLISALLIGFGFGTLVFFYSQWSDALKGEERLAQEKLLFQYETLKSQVNPHFLFNSLNTLSSLVHSNPSLSEEFIRKLSNIYRYILENQEKDLVPLTDELLFMREYFSLQKIRDEEKIELKVELTETENLLIPPVSLQLLIEDERLAAEKLEALISQVDAQIDVVAKLESVADSINWLASNPAPDLIFMDIQLDDGISFEIFDAVKVEAPVIFTTAFDQYAIRAFKVNSVDYLLKPIDRNALETALEKYRRVFRPAGMEEKLSKVFQQLSKPWKTRFFVKVGVHFQSVPVEEICCFFVEERCSFLKTQTGKNYALDYSLDQLQKRVDPELFFRINRNFMVNINCITEIISYSTNRLKLKLKNFDDEGLIVSRDKVSEFKQWLDR
jgi:DNA-binding LytR/AlgR family response regulator